MQMTDFINAAAAKARRTVRALAACPMTRCDAKVCPCSCSRAIRESDRMLFSCAQAPPDMIDVLNAAAAKAARQREKEDQANAKMLQKQMEQRRKQEEKQQQQADAQRRKMMEKEQREQERERQQQEKKQAKAEQLKLKQIQAALALKAPAGSNSAGVGKKHKPLTPAAAAGAAAAARAVLIPPSSDDCYANDASALDQDTSQHPISEHEATPASALASQGPAPDEVIVTQLVSMGFSENISKRAALAVNNASASAAAEWVLQHAQDPVQQAVRCVSEEGGGAKKTKEERQREKEEKQQRQAEARQHKLLEREQRAQEAERQRQEKEQAKREKTELQRAQKEQKQHAQKEESKLKELKKEQRMKDVALKKKQRIKYGSRANCFPTCLAGGRPKCICGRVRFPPDYIVVGPSPSDEEGIPHQVAEAFEANELKFGIAPTPHMRKLLMKSNQGRQILQDISTYGEYGKFHNYSESEEEIESRDDCSEDSDSGSDVTSDSDCVMYSDDSSASNTFNIFIF